MSPMPNSPLEFEPQHINIPFLKTAHVCRSPADTDTAEPEADLISENKQEPANKTENLFKMLLTIHFKHYILGNVNHNTALTCLNICMLTNLVAEGMYEKAMRVLLYFLFPTGTLRSAPRT